MKTVLLALALFVSPVRAVADTLSDLRGSLSRFKAASAVAGTMDISVVQQSDGRNEQGKATVQFESGPGGLSISYPAALIERMRVEERQRDANPDAQTPRTSYALSELSATGLAAALNAADDLLGDLHRAKVQNMKATTHEGRPARMITLSVAPRLSRKDRERVKSADVTLQLVTSNDYTPLSSVTTTRMKVSFLVVKFESTQVRSHTYGVRADRLVALRTRSQSSGSGLGQKFSSDVTTVLAVR